MPIAEAVRAAQSLDRERFQPVDPKELKHHIDPISPVIITRSMFLRSPLPYIPSSPDNLRQFYKPGIPQTRINPLFS